MNSANPLGPRWFSICFLRSFALMSLVTNASKRSRTTGARASIAATTSPKGRLVDASLRVTLNFVSVHITRSPARSRPTLRLLGRGFRCNGRRGLRPRRRWTAQLRLLDRWSNDGGEFLEELVGQLLGCRVNESTAKLRQPAAHFCLGFVFHQCPFAVVREMHGRAAPGVAGNTARTLPGKTITIGRVEIRQRDLPRKRRMDRPDPQLNFGGHLGVGELFERLATRNTLLEHGGVVRARPHGLPARCKPTCAVHVHQSVPLARIAPRGAGLHPGRDPCSR